jgi:hypothetical protein
MLRRSAFLVLVAAGAILAAGLALGGGVAAGTRPSTGRLFVATLPQIGTVYARYYCSGERSRRFGLGIHFFSLGQSGLVRFRAGHFGRDREVQPGDPTAWFPYRPDRVEWLAAAAGGENGNVVGWVRVLGYGTDRANNPCSPNDPPRATVQVYPRGFDYDRLSVRFLRRLIG